MGCDIIACPSYDVCVCIYILLQRVNCFIDIPSASDHGQGRIVFNSNIVPHHVIWTSSYPPPPQANTKGYIQHLPCYLKQIQQGFHSCLNIQLAIVPVKEVLRIFKLFLRTLCRRPFPILQNFTKPFDSDVMAPLSKCHCKTLQLAFSWSNEI